MGTVCGWASDYNPAPRANCRINAGPRARTSPLRRLYAIFTPPPFPKTLLRSAMDISPRLRTELYPPLEPFNAGRLQLDRIHTMYWEESGNPRGEPVVFLHGGPGAGSAPNHRRFFDPAHYRIVIFDQRGAGRSTPLGEVRENTTPLLIADIERLRQHLGIEQWIVFGGSWGSTLALAYGEAHPERCLGFALRGIFLCRPSEIDWFLYGLRNIFPEAWQKFTTPLPENERGDLLEGLHRQRRERFVVEPSHRAPGVVVAHQPDERRDGAVAVTDHEARHRLDIERRGRDVEGRHLFSITARNG